MRTNFFILIGASDVSGVIGIHITLCVCFVESVVSDLRMRQVYYIFSDMRVFSTKYHKTIVLGGIILDAGFSMLWAFHLLHVKILGNASCIYQLDVCGSL